MEEENPYLLGMYAPVLEEIDAADLEVVGEIPHDLNGVYLRNGPNPRFPPSGRYHWFDGDGMVHAMSFENGRARYRNTWVRTAALGREAAARRPLWSGVMEPPHDNPVGSARGLPYKDSANTDLTYFRGKVLATWYLCGQPMALDPLSVRTLGPETFLDTLTGDMMAHPKHDEATGELMWFDYGARAPLLRYGVVGADGRLAHEVSIDLPGPRLPHDMAITEHWSILMDLPLMADPAAARQGRHKIVFDRSLPARFGVLPRYGTERRASGTSIGTERRASGTSIGTERSASGTSIGTGEVRWFEAEPCYIYHVVNAWESGSEVGSGTGPTITMDVCRVTRPEPVPTRPGPLGKLLGYLRLDARLHRYTFHLDTGECTETRLDDANTEFPSVDSRRVGRPHRYSYTTHIADAETVLFDGLVRHDAVTGARTEHRFGPGRYGSESPFAPRDGAGADDDSDGYLVSFVTDEASGRSEVCILDAADLAAGPVGRVLLPTRVPLGFHASWVRADQLGA